jgi:hypothetical protein
VLRRLTSRDRWGWVVAWIALALPVAAQPPRLPPKVITWPPSAQTASANPSAAYGILGEVARPGVYASPTAAVTVQELINQAGGLTARGSSAVRIVRQARTAQTVFFSPGGHDLLLPHDVVIVDDLGELRPEARNAAPAAPPGVWVCLAGIADRPVIVPLRPEEAQYATVMRMLGQSEKLAQSVRLTLPPRAPWPTSAATTIPSGAVLTFDRGLLVTQNLPAFPEAIPFATAAVPSSQPTIANSELPPTISQRAPSIGSDSELSATLASQVRSPVEAIPVPFPSPPSEDIPVEPTSLPIPGSRLQQQLVPAPTTAAPPERHAIDPRIAADKSVEILPDLDDDADLTDDAPMPRGLSLWQMLGIGGTVVSLIGIAIATRKYLDRHDPTQQPLQQRMPLPPAPFPVAGHAGSRPRFEIPPPPPPPLAKPLDSEPDDLEDILRGDLPIVSEAVEFPAQFRLQTQRDEAMLRLDAPAQRAVPTPHAAWRALPPRATARGEQAASAIPQPHFRARLPKSSETSEVSHFGAILKAGTPLERALSQLQGGPRS